LVPINEVWVRCAIEPACVLTVACDGRDDEGEEDKDEEEEDN
jgi:hypothetical protein